MAKDYVDREALRDLLHDSDAITYKGVKLLNEFPAADVVPVAHGRWVEQILTTLIFQIPYKSPYCHCTHCGAPIRKRLLKKWAVYHRYCGSCGAKMDSEAPA